MLSKGVTSSGLCFKYGNEWEGDKTGVRKIGVKAVSRTQAKSPEGLNGDSPGRDGESVRDFVNDQRAVLVRQPFILPW